MHGQKLVSLALVSGLTLVTAALWLGLSSARRDYFRRPDAAQSWAGKPAEESNHSWGILTHEVVQSQLHAILGGDAPGLHSRLECPAPDLSRYEYLRVSKEPKDGIRYFFALNLRECLSLLPTLLGGIIETIRLLGPKNCALSIVEGNSPDGTAEVLAALQEKLGDWTNTHFVLNNSINPLEKDRFPALAKLRNMALAPIFENPNRYLNATVLFINDVTVCAEDLLELLHQRVFQEADMTCAMDWVGGDKVKGEDPVFYDVYIARGISGDTFFEIPADASWRLAHNIFFNEPISKSRFENHQPIQVFACWNGAVAFTAAPLVDGLVRFRGSNYDEGECHKGEPELFCKDMWYHGYGRIAVIPSVNLEYSVDRGRYIKSVKGFASQLTLNSGPDEKIKEWLPPPDKVKCMPTFDRQDWRPWNETLEEKI